MAEQWVSAKQVRELGISTYSLCARLHKGLMAARADSTHRRDESVTLQKLPKEFWWGEGHEALEQDWETGDFSTWIEGRDYWQAFGVRFPLSGLLEMIEIERRPAVVRGLSVAGTPNWMSADEARKVAFTNGKRDPGPFLCEQARLGFVAAKAVEARGVANPDNFLKFDWEEREWEIPTWFWDGFAGPRGKGTTWEIGRFVGEGISPVGSRLIEAHDVHFLRESIEACFHTLESTSDGDTTAPRGGRRPKYDWPKAVVSVYGLIERGDLQPKVQADVEQALMRVLATGDDEPSESTVRPFAKLIWDESRKE